MSTFTARDDAEIFYKDWGTGQPVVFSHGWPLTADAWDAQMVFLGERGYRVIAHDRRGHGRSDQTWTGNDMDTYADDLAELIEMLDLRDAILVGHSTGGGEVARYIGRHGTGRVAKVVLLGAVPPLMLKTVANPDGLPIEAFDQIRAGVRANRSQFFRDLAIPFYGLQPRGRGGLAGGRGGVLAAGDAGRPQGRARLHQAVLGDGFHGGPEEVRRADADRPWRRRPDRPDRHLRARLREAREGRHAEDLIQAAPMASPPRGRTSSTPTWSSSSGRAHGTRPCPARARRRSRTSSSRLLTGSTARGATSRRDPCLGPGERDAMDSRIADIGHGFRRGS